MDQFLTYKTPKIGPAFNSTTYIYKPVTSFGRLFGVPRWDETAGNKVKQGEKDKQIEKKKPKIQENGHDSVAVS